MEHFLNHLDLFHVIICLRAHRKIWNLEMGGKTWKVIRQTITFKRANQLCDCAKLAVALQKPSVPFPRCCFNVKMSSRSDKTAAEAASTLISLAAAVVHNS